MGEIRTLEHILEKIRGKRVYFDTVVLIYALEGNSIYVNRAVPFVEASENRECIGFTGVATLTEMLVGAIRKGNTNYAEQLKAMFKSGDLLQCVSHNDEVFIASASLRATSNLKAIDALHFSTALALGCQFFLTNDASFKSTQTMEVIRLTDIEPTPRIANKN